MVRKTKTGGRKAGTPNKANALVRDRIDQVDPIGWLLTLHKKGTYPEIKDGKKTRRNRPLSFQERTSIAQYLDRKITPNAKERTITFDVGKIDSPEDALKTMAKVIEALGAGKLSPSEANAVCGVIGNYIKAFEVNEILARIEALEETVVP
ncbi:MAG: hypothetical protein V3U57_00230 [Robiginitomaculum sp.]